MADRKLRVARVSTVPFFVLTQLSSQLHTLHALGTEITVIASDDEFASQMAALEEVAFMPINISRNISPLNDVISLMKLFRAFRSAKFDVVHSTTPKAGLLCAIAAFFAGAPIRIHTFTGQPWVTMSGFKRLILKNCDRLIGILNTHSYTDSDSQRQFLIDHKIVRPRGISVLGSGSLAGVDLNRFRRSNYSGDDILALKDQLGIPKDSKVILFVGRITQDKGIRELVTAFQQIASNDASVHLLLVGPFEDNGQAILDSVSGSEANRRIHSIGYSDEPEKYMAIADLLCLPSYREGFGTVVIEAGAMGLPTVGTDIYGLSDAVLNGVTGVLVPARDTLALEKALVNLLNDDNARLRMGAHATERACSEFDSVKCATLLLDDYKRLFNER
ncbi:glycosyltransferase family 4 protein [Pseudomonas poae]|uniref:Glycosyltransferase family 1 protein n=1 Tax=Pseudomonas poae TaxID=200451 RepID=A0A2S9ETS2_9PSED|nr:glycosyltransferase family 4 protein [Pseudomonas poae]PRA28244.1 glycosyltransferase family 1 protein [Pseudomonas poae]PRC19237.1 glycosyltransferase family 1 protein [Pseudomonas poae]